MFEKNVGNIDRYIRFALGIILLMSGIYFITQDNLGLGIGLSVFSLVPLVTGTAGTCPIWSLLGVNTNSQSKVN